MCHWTRVSQNNFAFQVTEASGMKFPLLELSSPVEWGAARLGRTHWVWFGSSLQRGGHTHRLHWQLNHFIAVHAVDAISRTDGNIYFCSLFLRSVLQRIMQIILISLVKGSGIPPFEKAQQQYRINKNWRRLQIGLPWVERGRKKSHSYMHYCQ